MLKVGLLGRGTISFSHTNAYERIENVQIVACCDIRPEQLEGMVDVRKYTDIDTFLAEESGKLDYVDICLPTYLHAEASIKARSAPSLPISKSDASINCMVIFWHGFAIAIVRPL